MSLFAQQALATAVSSQCVQVDDQLIISREAVSAALQDCWRRAGKSAKEISSDLKRLWNKVQRALRC